MGAGQSGGIEIGGSTMGYQVLRVYPDSPGSRAGLKAYFDFIIAIGNTRFNKENSSLREILKASVGQKLAMVVYNTRTKSVRDVEIVPSTSWGGNGLLGVSIKHSSFDRADERVWHVVEVEPGSPALQAGFKAGEDYVIGSDSILQENDDLYNLIEAHENKALKLFVYNVKTDNCREVVCYPNSKWGGRGFLGCEFGHGLLHRVPVSAEVQGSSNAKPQHQHQQQQLQQTHQQQQSAPAPSNPYSFQGQFTQLHNATVNKNFNGTSDNNNFQRPAMNMQPGEQMFHKALFDGAPQQQQQQQQQQPQPPPQQSQQRSDPMQSQHQPLSQDHQGQQQLYQPSSVSCGPKLPSPPIQAVTQSPLQAPPPPQNQVHHPQMQQHPQQHMHQQIQSSMHQQMQAPVQQPPPVMMQPPQTFAQLANVHQPPQHYPSPHPPQQQSLNTNQPNVYYGNNSLNSPLAPTPPSMTTNTADQQSGLNQSSPYSHDAPPMPPPPQPQRQEEQQQQQQQQHHQTSPYQQTPYTHPPEAAPLTSSSDSKHPLFP